MRVNTTLREGHKLEHQLDGLIWIFGNEGYYVMRLSRLSGAIHEVCYWFMGYDVVPEWVHVGDYDTCEDALTAFWNVYQLGLWKDVL